MNDGDSKSGGWWGGGGHLRDRVKYSCEWNGK